MRVEVEQRGVVVPTGGVPWIRGRGIEEVSRRVEVEQRGIVYLR